MTDGEAMLAEIQQALREREQAGTQALITLHGGIGGWHAECCVRRSRDKDFRLARTIVRLLRRGGNGDCLRLLSGEQRQLDAEPAVLAFWRSVAQSGTQGWLEERARVREVEQAASVLGKREDRLLMLDVWAVRSLVNTYRTWGQMIIDNENAGG